MRVFPLPPEQEYHAADVDEPVVGDKTAGQSLVPSQQGSHGLLTTGPPACLARAFDRGHPGLFSSGTSAHTGPMADDAPWIDPVVVPDDIRALQADIEAYHRELREARHPRIRRLASSVLV